MSSDTEKAFDAEAFMRSVEEMLLMDEISEEQKIEILQKLLKIAEED
jgi:hypothetical protein